jgi:hypothetical protein
MISVNLARKYRFWKAYSLADEIEFYPVVTSL